MNVDHLFDHALGLLPDAVADLLREGRRPSEYVFASFDGTSELGIALICSDLGERNRVLRLIAEANGRGEELVVSIMVTKSVLERMLAAACLDPPTRLAVRMWLERPLDDRHYRVLAVADEAVRAAAVDTSDPADEAVPPSMLN